MSPLQSVSSDSASYLGSVDPRARIVVAVLLSIVVAWADRLVVPATALTVTILWMPFSGLSAAMAFRRLLPLNLLMAFLAVVLPLTTPGTPLWPLASLGFSREGLQLAATIALKGNTIVLTMLVLTGSMDATMLGHTLSHLRVPDKLTHLLLFTVRYLDVLHREYLRLRSAVKVRGFRPRMDRHTYRTYGYLIGMLLVRSFDRSERIVAAMKCRGFHGRFYMLDHFAFSKRDVPFCIASAGVLILLATIQWAQLEWPWPIR